MTERTILRARRTNAGTSAAARRAATTRAALVAAAAALAGGCARREPSAREVAAELARSPEFARAVAEQLALRSPRGAPGATAQPPAAAPAASPGATAPAIPPTPPIEPSAAGAAAPGAGDTVTIAINAAGNTLIGDRHVTDAELTTILRTRVAAAPQLRAIIAADRAVAQGRVVHVIDRVRAAGVTRFAIQTPEAP